jgi:hypothetical protein
MATLQQNHSPGKPARRIRRSPERITVTIEHVEHFHVPTAAAVSDPGLGEQLAALAKRLDDVEYEAASVSGLRAHQARIRKLEEAEAKRANGADGNGNGVEAPAA